MTTDSLLLRSSIATPMPAFLFWIILFILSFIVFICEKELIDIRLFKDPLSIPRGISEIPSDIFKNILKLTETDESIIID